MRILNYQDIIVKQFNNKISIKEKRPGIMQLFIPIYHEDGDMIDIFMQQSPANPNKLRITDCGMTLMRLSYTFEIDTPNKEKIFMKILSENAVQNDNGVLFIDTDISLAYQSIMQFSHTVAKILNMNLLKREYVTSLFYDLLDEFVITKLIKYSPQKNYLPLKERDDLEVDFLLNIPSKKIYLFGVKDAAKARIATISCLEFQRSKLPFKSIIVLDDYDNLPRKDRKRLMSAADKLFPSLDDFQEHAEEFLEREAV